MNCEPYHTLNQAKVLMVFAVFFANMLIGFAKKTARMIIGFAVFFANMWSHVSKFLENLQNSCLEAFKACHKNLIIFITTWNLIMKLFCPNKVTCLPSYASIFMCLKCIPHFPPLINHLHGYSSFSFVFYEGWKFSSFIKYKGKWRNAKTKKVQLQIHLQKKQDVKSKFHE